MLILPYNCRLSHMCHRMRWHVWIHCLQPSGSISFSHSEQQPSCSCSWSSDSKHIITNYQTLLPTQSSEFGCIWNRFNKAKTKKNTKPVRSKKHHWALIEQRPIIFNEKNWMTHFWVGLPSFSLSLFLSLGKEKGEISGVPEVQTHIKTTGPKRGRQRGRNDVWGEESVFSAEDNS